MNASVLKEFLFCPNDLTAFWTYDVNNRRSSSTYNERGDAQTSTYQANNLNQYISRTTPGYAAVRGEASPDATVTVNGNPTFRLGAYYFGSDNFNNSSSGDFAELETYATLAQTDANCEATDDLVSSATNQVYLAQSPETFAYDADGNQTLISTKTGLWRVTYNGENRPVRWVRDSDGVVITMSYDHMGRRRTKNSKSFYYNDYLQVADSDGNRYVWDPTEPTATRPLAWMHGETISYYTHDGNKNVSEVITNDGTVAAHYEYAPFGAAILQHGNSASTNPWRFSSEYAENDTATVYYNYRHYEPVMGRWLSRDSMEEEGGENLYCFSKNSMVGNVDILGLFEDGYVLECIEYKWRLVRRGKGGFARKKVCVKWRKKPTEYKGHDQFTNLAGIPEKCRFDFTLEDHSWWSRPENPVSGTPRHFRTQDKVAIDLEEAIKNCNADDFQRYMHQYQDTFVHSGKGYGMPFGHLWDSIIGNNPDHDDKAWEQANKDTVGYLKEWTDTCKLCDENKCRWGKKQ